MLSILFSLAIVGDAPVTASETVSTEKTICRREAQIGSLVRKKKVCRTESEWRTLAQEAKDYSNGVQKRSGEITNR